MPTMLTFPTIDLCLVLTTCLFSFIAGAEQQPFHGNDEPEAFHVAIVGAGLAGASSAYYLSNLSTSYFSHPLKITVYEASSNVGGQVKRIFPPLDEHALEAGATHFFKDDWCLTEAAQSTNLTRRRASPVWGDIWAWNEKRSSQDRFCYKEAPRKIPPFWDPRPHARKEVRDAFNRFLDTVTFEWENSWVPWRTRRKISSLQAKFNSLGQNGTFQSIQEELEKLGLGESISSSAEQFLDNMGVPRSLQANLIEPCVRDSFGMSLKDALGLHVIASVGSTRSSPIAIDGGNVNLIGRMIEQSGAELRLDSRVTKVGPGIHRRFALEIGTSKLAKPQYVEYDAIILTGDSATHLRPTSMQQPTSIQSHVTHFATMYWLKQNEHSSHLGWIPLAAFTTANSSFSDTNDSAHITRLTTHGEFYIDRRDCSEDDLCDQAFHVHRIDSNQRLTQESLHAMMTEPRHDQIFWIDRQSWNRTFPPAKASGDTGFSNIELEPNLFNVKSDMLDTMEMSCRMGRNVALKLYDQRLLTGFLGQETNGIWLS